MTTTRSLSPGEAAKRNLNRWCLEEGADNENGESLNWDGEICGSLYSGMDMSALFSEDLTPKMRDSFRRSSLLDCLDEESTDDQSGSAKATDPHEAGHHENVQTTEASSQGQFHPSKGNKPARYFSPEFCKSDLDASDTESIFLNWGNTHASCKRRAYSHAIASYNQVTFKPQTVVERIYQRWATILDRSFETKCHSYIFALFCQFFPSKNAKFLAGNHGRNLEPAQITTQQPRANVSILNGSLVQNSEQLRAHRPCRETDFCVQTGYANDCLDTLVEVHLGVCHFNDSQRGPQNGNMLYRHNVHLDAQKMAFLAITSILRSAYSHISPSEFLTFQRQLTKASNLTEPQSLVKPGSSGKKIIAPTTEEPHAPPCLHPAQSMCLENHKANDSRGIVGRESEKVELEKQDSMKRNSSLPILRNRIIHYTSRLWELMTYSGCSATSLPLKLNRKLDQFNHSNIQHRCWTVFIILSLMIFFLDRFIISMPWVTFVAKGLFLYTITAAFVTVNLEKIFAYNTQQLVGSIMYGSRYICASINFIRRHELPPTGYRVSRHVPLPSIIRKETCHFLEAYQKYKRANLSTQGTGLNASAVPFNGVPGSSQTQPYARHNDNTKELQLSCRISYEAPPPISDGECLSNITRDGNGGVETEASERQIERADFQCTYRKKKKNRKKSDGASVRDCVGNELTSQLPYCVDALTENSSASHHNEASCKSVLESGAPGDNKEHLLCRNPEDPAKYEESRASVPSQTCNISRASISSENVANTPPFYSQTEGEMALEDRCAHEQRNKGKGNVTKILELRRTGGRQPPPREHGRAFGGSVPYRENTGEDWCPITCNFRWETMILLNHMNTNLFAVLHKLCRGAGHTEKCEEAIRAHRSSAYPFAEDLHMYMYPEFAWSNQCLHGLSMDNGNAQGKQMKLKQELDSVRNRKESCNPNCVFDHLAPIQGGRKFLSDLSLFAYRAPPLIFIYYRMFECNFLIKHILQLLVLRFVYGGSIVNQSSPSEETSCLNMPERPPSFCGEWLNCRGLRRLLTGGSQKVEGVRGYTRVQDSEVGVLESKGGSEDRRITGGGISQYIRFQKSSVLGDLLDNMLSRLRAISLSGIRIFELFILTIETITALSSPGIRELHRYIRSKKSFFRAQTIRGQKGGRTSSPQLLLAKKLENALEYVDRCAFELRMGSGKMVGSRILTEGEKGTTKRRGSGTVEGGKNCCREKHGEAGKACGERIRGSEAENTLTEDVIFDKVVEELYTTLCPVLGVASDNLQNLAAYVKNVVVEKTKDGCWERDEPCSYLQRRVEGSFPASFEVEGRNLGEKRRGKQQYDGAYEVHEDVGLAVSCKKEAACDWCDKGGSWEGFDIEELQEVLRGRGITNDGVEAKEKDLTEMGSSKNKSNRQAIQPFKNRSVTVFEKNYEPKKTGEKRNVDIIFRENEQIEGQNDEKWQMFNNKEYQIHNKINTIPIVNELSQFLSSHKVTSEEERIYT